MVHTDVCLDAFRWYMPLKGNVGFLAMQLSRFTRARMIG